MHRILDQVAHSHLHFAPSTVQEYFAFQLARKLNDAHQLREYLSLATMRLDAQRKALANSSYQGGSATTIVALRAGTSSFRISAMKIRVWFNVLRAETVSAHASIKTHRLPNGVSCDGLGSVIALSDAVGKLRTAYVYDAWGDSLITAPHSIGTKNKFQFTGEPLDPETGLYFLRARYYDPSIGRFLTVDPLRGSMTINSNPYQYAFANPVRYTDPSGLMGIDDDGQVEGAFTLGDGSPFQYPTYGLNNANSTPPVGPHELISATVEFTTCISGTLFSLGRGACEAVLGPVATASIWSNPSTQAFGAAWTTTPFLIHLLTGEATVPEALGTLWRLLPELLQTPTPVR